MGLRFLNPRKPRSADELSPTQKEQLRLAGKLYDGNDLDPAERLSPEREPGPDGGGFAGFLELWDLEEDGEPRYEAFLYVVDSGTVFRRGTTEIVAERIQTYFQAKDEAFADALREAYHAGCKEFAAQLKEGAAQGGPWAAYRDAMEEVEK
jgi:hypothetical protein